MPDSEDNMQILNAARARNMASTAGREAAEMVVGDLPDKIDRLRKEMVWAKKGMLTLRQLADHYLDGRVKVSTLRRWRREEGMPTYKRGRIRLVDIEEFEAWWKGADLDLEG